jgi:hypothetical protein
MADWNQQINTIQKLRQQRREADEALYAAQTNLLKIKDSDGEQKRKVLEEQRNRAKANLSAAVNNLQAAIAGIYIEDPHPKNAIANLNDNIPFLLLPVRIETRFMATGTSPELWLRVYPDDIAIHTHETTLTDDEVEAGEKYWRNLFTADKANSDDEKNEMMKEAWSDLASSFGSNRAAWIAKETKPSNWSDDLGNITSTDGLVFPPHDLTSTNAWSRAPRTNVLPDRFVVMLYHGDTISKEVVGELIPDELFVGPDPLDADSAFQKSADDTLTFGESYNWTSDFDKALKCGMGFKIPITADEATRGFDKILVIGACLSTDEKESQNALETLIDNHHYSPNGFSIVTQGTATNNTEQDGSGFTTSDPFNANSYFVETGNALFNATDDCNGKNLADALGINYEPLQFVLNSDAKERLEAMAMNTALYPSTLGYYFDTMMKPVLNETDQGTLRNFFKQYVFGGATLPAIRVGNQPYGILLTSDFSKWKWTQKESLGNTFLTKLYSVLDYYHSIWKTLLPQLMYTGKPGADPSEVLMNILGLQAGSVSFYQRVAYSTENLINNAAFMNQSSYVNDLAASFTSKRLLLDFLETFGYNPTGPDGKFNVPQLLRLVYHHDHFRLDAANLIDNVPLSEKDPIRYYDPNTKKNYIHWLLENNSVASLEKQDFTPGVVPNSVLYMQLWRSCLLEITKASVNWFQKNNIELSQVIQPVNFYNIRPAGNLTKWEVIKAKVGNALPQHPQSEMAVADYLLTSGKNETEAAFMNEMREALKSLADLPTARLERYFTEHIDTCTYRLDAWQSALFSQRLQKQRQTQTRNGEQGINRGIHLAACGIVMDVRPSAKRRVVSETVPVKLQPINQKPLYEYADNGGFVHAPSINQATAAAVLRSGYLNHATSEQPDLMAVNLSSQRVRLAAAILGGIQQGHALEELLGYQFERGLHDKGSLNDDLKKLNEYIYDYRDAFQVEQNFVQQQGNNNGVVETIKANNVVNGLTLAESNLAFPYGATLDMTGLSAAQQSSIQAAIADEKDKLADTLDAVKDLLLSESVYQMVQGNFDRAGAITTALKDAHIPPEIEIINTPRSSHLSFTNRVTIQFEQLSLIDPGVNPWPSVLMTSRAKMEPGMNKWLGKIIGDPAQLTFAIATINNGAISASQELTIDSIGLQPIDLIYITGNELNTGAGTSSAMSELENRIAYGYRSQNAIDDETQVSIKFMEASIAPGKKPLGSILPLMRMLKSVITDSRPVHAQDFDSPSKPLIADKANPKGYIVQNLLEKIQNAFSDYQDRFHDITDPLITKTEGSVNLKLGDLFIELDNDQKGFADIGFIFGSIATQALRDALALIAGFGSVDCFPRVLDASADNKKIILLEQARDAARRMNVAITQITGILNDVTAPGTGREAQVTKLTEAGKILFGNVFTILPPFNYNNPDHVRLSHEDKNILYNYAKSQLKMNFVAEEWLQSVSNVRPRLAKWDYIRTLYELSNDDSLEVDAVQLPYRSNDSWIAVEFPSTFDITDDTLSIVIQGEAAFSVTDPQCGLLIDDWTEVIPNKEEITGIAFNYNQPNAMAPQALLLAVTPEEKGKWSWDELVGIVNDTFLRAKLRAVEPRLLDTINKPETGVLLPALLAEFSKNDLDFSLDYARNVGYMVDNIPLSAISL